jgi:hypothetical protein
MGDYRAAQLVKATDSFQHGCAADGLSANRKLGAKDLFLARSRADSLTAQPQRISRAKNAVRTILDRSVFASDGFGSSSKEKGIDHSCLSFYAEVTRTQLRSNRAELANVTYVTQRGERFMPWQN